MDFSRQPLQGSDIAAFVFAVLALLFFALWRRDRERGMGWLAAAYVVLATQYALNGATLPVDELANPLATALISIGIASFTCVMGKCHQVLRLSARRLRRGASAGDMSAQETIVQRCGLSSPRFGKRSRFKLRIEWR